MQFEQHCLNPFGLLIQGTSQQSLSQLDVSQLTQLIGQHGIVLFRGFSAMADQQMIDFASQFGPLLAWDFGYVLDLKIQKKPQNHIFTQGKVELHWDGAFADVEPRFNFFQCLESGATSGGGETTFLNTVKLLQSLPDDQRQLWQDLVIRYTTAKKAHYGGTIEKPLISQHPTTQQMRMQFIEPFNQDNLAVNPVDTQILGWDSHDSDRLLREIIDYCYQSEYFYQHQWVKGDYLLVDNHALLHGRSKFQGHGLERSLKRIHILFDQDPSQLN